MSSNVSYSDLERVKRKNDELTDMLCTLMRSLEGKIEFPPKLAEWFEDHKKWDAQHGR